MNQRAAFSVLFLVAALAPLGRAMADPQPVPSPSEEPSSSVAVPSPPAPAVVPSPAEAPLAPPASTSGYTQGSTPVYAALPAPAPSPVLPVGPATSLLRDHRYSDAHVDRVLFVPTAETHPAGTFYLTSYEVVLLQAGYAVTDRTQITLSGMPPLANETVLPFDLSLKTVLARAPEYRVAALGSVSGISGTDFGTVVVGRVGGVVQLCFEWTCRSSVSIGSDVALAGPAIVVGNGAGIVLRASDHVSVLFEADAAIPIGSAVNQFNGLSVAPGVRFAGEHLAIDLAFAHRLDQLEGPSLPFIAATYRTAGR